MKKLFFTTIAFLAFSSVLSAKTIAIEEVNCEISKTEVFDNQNVLSKNKKEDLWLCVEVAKNVEVLSDGSVMVDIILKCRWF